MIFKYSEKIKMLYLTRILNPEIY